MCAFTVALGLLSLHRPSWLISASSGAPRPAVVLGGGVRVGLSLLVKGSGYRSCPGLVTDRRPSVVRTAAPLLWLPPFHPILVPTSHLCTVFLSGLWD